MVRHVPGLAGMDRATGMMNSESNIARIGFFIVRMEIVESRVMRFALQRYNFWEIMPRNGIKKGQKRW